MFTDESRFSLQLDEKRVSVEPHNRPQNITENHTFRGESIMLWAGITVGYRSDLHMFRWSSVMAVHNGGGILDLTVRL